MAAEFFSSLGIEFSNRWLEAFLSVAFYIALYSICRGVLKIIKIKSVARIARLSNAHAKTDIFLVIYKLLKRILQLTTLYFIILTIPVVNRHDELLLNICFIAGILITISTTFR